MAFMQAMYAILMAVTLSGVGMTVEQAHRAGDNYTRTGTLPTVENIQTPRKANPWEKRARREGK